MFEGLRERTKGSGLRECRIQVAGQAGSDNDWTPPVPHNIAPLGVGEAGPREDVRHTPRSRLLLPLAQAGSPMAELSNWPLGLEGGTQAEGHATQQGPVPEDDARRQEFIEEYRRVATE